MHPYRHHHAHCRGSIRVGLAIWLMLLLGGVAAAAPTVAAPAVLLAPAVPEAPRAAQPHGVFYQQELLVAVRANPVWLAASADGTGDLCTDDQATVQFLQAGNVVQRWTHRFARADRQAIVCIPAQPVYLPTTPGIYRVTIVLEDLYPDTWGSRPYMLVGATAASTVATTIPEPHPGRAEATDTVSTVGSPNGQTPVPIPVPSTDAVAGAGLSMEQPPTPYPAPTATLVQPETATAGPGAASRGVSARREWLPALPDGIAWPSVLVPGAALLLGTLLLGMLFWRRHAHRQQTLPPPLTGMILLFDQDSREAHTEVFVGAGAMVEVQRHPLRVVAVPTSTPSDRAIARIQATTTGMLLHEVTASAAPEPVRLRHDQRYALADGAVTLRYRDPHLFHDH
jgi:hypothetical protein